MIRFQTRGTMSLVPKVFASLCLILAVITAQDVKAQKDTYNGIWVRASVNGEPSLSQDGKTKQPYYKAIQDSSFMVMCFSANPNSMIKGFFEAKGGYYSYLDDKKVEEGDFILPVRMENDNMIVDWKPKDVTNVEVWEKYVPDAETAKLIDLLTSNSNTQSTKKSKVSGTWKLKEQYIMAENSRHYEPVDQKYKIIGDDMYCGFYINGTQEKTIYFRGWYGDFSYKIGDKVSENGEDATRIIWTGNNEFVYMYCPNREKDPNFFIYEIWVRSELPELISKAISALK